MSAPLPSVSEVGSAEVARLAERALLGAVLSLTGSDAAVALARVEPEDFADPQHRAIWQALRSLGEQGAPLPAGVVPRLVELGLLSRDRAGLVAVQVADLLGECPVPAIWPAYARVVLRESARRTIVEVAARAVQAAEGPDLATAVEVLSAGLVRISEAVARAMGAIE